MQSKIATCKLLSDKIFTKNVLVNFESIEKNAQLFEKVWIFFDEFDSFQSQDYESEIKFIFKIWLWELLKTHGSNVHRFMNERRHIYYEDSKTV